MSLLSHPGSLAGRFCRPSLAFAIALYTCGDGEFWVWVILIVGFFIGWSKTAYFYLPALVFLFFLLVGRRPIAWFFVFAVVTQVVVMRPVMHGEYKRVNPYHSVYFGALATLSAQELGHLNSIGGKPLLRECVGVAFYFPEGEKCLRDANIERADVMHVLREKPQVLWRMFERALREGKEINLTYLGMAKSGEVSSASWVIFNGWRFLFLHGAQYALLVLLFMGVAALMTIRRCENAPLLVSGVFVLLFGWSQYLAALGDGFYELTKHLSIGNYALSLGGLFVFFGILGLVRDLALRVRSHTLAGI